jgi:hypothetical protein
MARIGRVRPRASLGRLAAAAGGTAALVVAVLAAANPRLHGWPLVLLVAVGGLAGACVAEASQRSGGAQVLLAAVGAFTGAIVMFVGLLLEAPSTARPVTGAPLRVTASAQDPGFFRVAFFEDPGVPAEDAGWRDLIARGGVDIGTSVVRLTLANRSRRPLTISDIHLQVVGSSASPAGASAAVFTQGDNGLKEFDALLEDASEGSVAKLYRGSLPTADVDPPPTPFFASNYISLKPGEIYEALVTVVTHVPQLIRYRFAIAGSTPDGPFETAVRPLRITGGHDRFEHTYLWGFAAFARANQCSTEPVRNWSEVSQDELRQHC